MAYNHNSPLTGVPNKVSTEEKTYRIIDKILPYPRNWWIGLVGHAEELPRHIEMCRSIGIPSQRMMIVEQDKRIASDLEKAAKPYQCIVKQGDFKEILFKYISSYRFSLIDYDGTRNLSQYELDLIDLYKLNLYHTGILRIVASTRKETPEEFKKISEQFDLPHFYRSVKMDSEIKKKILEQSISKEAKNLIINDKSNNLDIFTFTYPTDPIIVEEYCFQKGLHCIYENYKGVSTMRNIIISENSKLFRVGNTISPEIDFKEIRIGGNWITKMIGKGNATTTFYNIKGNIYYGQILVAIL